MLRDTTFCWFFLLEPPMRFTDTGVWKGISHGSSLYVVLCVFNVKLYFLVAVVVVVVVIV